MNLEFIILLILTVAGFAVVFWFMARRRQPQDQSSQLLMLQGQLNEIVKTMDTKLGESHRAMQMQFGQSNQIVKDVTEWLTKLDETNKRVVGFADQLKNLQDVLKNPKQRGVLGEYYLETLLKNVFPPGVYQMQYPFKDGTIVDAVIFMKDMIIPIDSKFSLENYNRIIEEKNEVERERLEKIFKQDLKNRIDETAKYVRPDEGTFDFAFMFIPAEGIYYDLLINRVGSIKTNTRDLIDYAFIEKKVHIVSPTTLLSHLKMVMQGLRALQIEESAKEIGKRVGELGKHLSGYQEYMRKVGVHLGTTVSMYNQAYKEFGKVDKDVLKITGDKVGVDVIRLEAPDVDVLEE